ncbi:MAG: glycosyltransferase [Mogibacterium sp.]|nr:glycosyltransferase [Mogibacterium sp.]
MKKLLLVANVAKEHVLKFHVPTIRELSRRGWTVDVACAGDEDIPYCNEQFRMNWKRNPLSRKTIGGIRQLKRAVDSGDYDIVYCHTPMGGLGARLAAAKARKRGTKVIYCVHGFHFFEGAELINWLIYYPAERLLSLLTDMIITINREDYERAGRKFRKGLKLRLIPGMGADFSRLEVEGKEEIRRAYRKELDIPEDALVMLYIAELTQNKNQKMLIEALTLLRDKDINAYLVLAGPDQEEGWLERYAEASGQVDYCRFLGWREDVGELLAMADVYTASSIREGMTINLVEAIYAGLPIVATDNRGHRMAAADYGEDCLVKIGDYHKMAEMIEGYMRASDSDGSAVNERTSDKSGSAANSHISDKYDSERIARVIADILEGEVD